ncbi:DUF2341 domain-containing protein [Cupriavidus necator]|uniref:DUF2341 domain-containing protein n=1 Tax=Cupriavidus necator TaxID=106590 RepID=UPI0005B35C16|nr:DUF2341 domain-containing protein [Cupriavidus necator]
MADPYIDNVALLSHFENVYGSATAIWDSSKYLTGMFSGCVGTTAMSSVQAKFGTTSLKTGSANGNYWRYPPGRLLDFGSADFTVECFVWPVSQGTDYGAIMGRWDDATPANQDWLVARAANGAVNVSVGGVQLIAGSAGDLPTGAFAHVALTRQGNTLTVWINGVAKGTGTISSAISCSLTQPFTLGQSNFTAGSTFLEAYYDELRLTLGVARYTSGFSAPSTQFDDWLFVAVLLHFDQKTAGNSLQWIDSSRSGRLMTSSTATPVALSASPAKFGSSGFFGGNTYLNTPDAPELAVSNYDFCVEGWFYPTTVAAGTTVLVSKYNASGAAAFRILRVGNQVQGQASTNGSSYTQSIGPAGTLVANTWYHVALVRYGTTLTLYLNGVSVGTATFTAGQQVWGTANPLYFGGEPSTFFFTGYLDEWRMVVGSPVYYGAFTPPSAPFADPAFSRRTYSNVLPMYAYTKLPSSPVTGPQSVKGHKGYAGQTDQTWGGRGRVAGQTTVNNTPTPQKVRLIEEGSGLVQSAWSDASGNYVFDNVNESYKYQVLGRDYSKTYNAVVQDMVTPVLMPLYSSYPSETIAKLRRKITMPQAVGLGTNHAVLVRIGESPLAMSQTFQGTNTALAADVALMLKTFPTAKGDYTADIAFTDLAGNSLPYWLERVVGTTPNRTAFYWVNLGGQNLDSGNAQFSVVYNTVTPVASSGAAAFPLLFDDFDLANGAVPDSKWLRYNDSGGFVTCNGASVVAVQGRSAFVELRSSASFNSGVEVIARYNNIATSGGNGAGNTDRALGFVTGTQASPSFELVLDSPQPRLTQSRLAINNEADSATTGDFSPKKASGRVQLGWGADGNAQLIIDDVLLKTRTGVSASSAQLLMARTWESNQSSTIDYVMVRKYVANAPALIIGYEELAP